MERGEISKIFWKQVTEAAVFWGRPGLARTAALRAKMDEEAINGVMSSAHMAAAHRRAVIYGDYRGSREHFKKSIRYGKDK